MANEGTIYTLVASSNTSGRYALDEPGGPTISSGQGLAILLNGVWTEGSVEHASHMYVNRGLQYLGDKGPESRTLEGYYFIGSHGGVCGLCVGMKVRLI